MIFVVIAIVIAVGSNIVSNVQNSSDTTTSHLYNSSEEGLVAIQDVAEWQTTIGIIIAAAIVIGILMYFWQGRRY